jgi:hypothetical protein
MWIADPILAGSILVAIALLRKSDRRVLSAEIAITRGHQKC